MGQAIGYEKNSRDGLGFSGSDNPMLRDAISRLCSGLCNIVTPLDFAKTISDTYLQAALLSFMGFRRSVSLHYIQRSRLYKLLSALTIGRLQWQRWQSRHVTMLTKTHTTWSGSAAVEKHCCLYLHFHARREVM